MALYLGQFLLTGELLDRVAAPAIMKRYRFVHSISFRIVDHFVIAEISGRYSLIGFKGFVAAHLVKFNFGRSVYRVELELSVDLRPRFLNPLLTGLLKKKLDRRPGLTWAESRIQLELAKMPFFKQIKERLPDDSLFSQLEIIRDGQGGGGMLFKIYLNEPHF